MSDPLAEVLRVEANALRVQADAKEKLADLLDQRATDELLDAHQAAPVIRRSRRGVLELVKSGALPAV